MDQSYTSVPAGTGVIVPITIDPLALNDATALGRQEWLNLDASV